MNFLSVLHSLGLVGPFAEIQAERSLFLFIKISIGDLSKKHRISV